MNANESLKKENPILEVVKNYLKMNTSGALLVTGDWGCGKTYYFKNELFDKIQKIEENEYIPILVSLFGLTALSDVPQRVLYSYLDKVGKNGTSYGKFALIAKNFTEALPFIKGYVDIDKLIGSGEGIYKIIPENVVICFDDFERANKVLSKNEIFGMINELVENKKYKIVVIANEEIIDKEELLFKEKVIEKTYRFMPDIEALFIEIVKTYKNDSFSAFMTNNLILRSLNSKNDFYVMSKNTELKKNLSNVRILKFAIEHFYKIFELYNKEIDSLLFSKLKNLWIFTLSVSIEYKINNLSFNDNRSINDIPKVARIGSSIDKLDELLDDFENDVTESEKDKKEKDITYAKKFLKNYFQRLSEELVYHEELYNFITSGKSIDFEILESNINKEFNIVNNTINPAKVLLDQFFNNYWQFSNEQIPKKLNELLDYVNDGKFDDYMAYINASVYLIDFKELFEENIENIIIKVKAGIDKFTERIEVNELVKIHLQIARNQLNPNVIEVFDYIISSIDFKIEVNHKKAVVDLEMWFQTDIEKFVNEFISFDFASPPIHTTGPILKDFNVEIVKSKVKHLEPNEVVCLKRLLEQRYLKVYPLGSITEEIPFLMALKFGLNEINFEVHSMSNLILKEIFIPVLDKAIGVMGVEKANQSDNLLS